MSFRAMSAVWNGFPLGGSELLAILALADWSDDDGQCWPSIASIARKTRLSEKQARRVVHSIIESGYLTVTDNAQGGAMSRRYQINLKRLATPPAGGSPPISGSPPAGVPNPSHGWEATPPAGGSRTISEPSVNRQESGRAGATPPSSPVGEKMKKEPTITFDTFVERRKAAGKKLIDGDDSIFDWAEKAGIPEEWLRLAWVEFSARYRGNAKRYSDWPATFRNAVRNNWFRFWRLADSGQYVLTTEGEMARRATLAEDRKAHEVTA